MRDSSYDYDVVICGAGPTGLVMALGLLDPNLRILLLTKHTQRSLCARAVNLWPRNIESLFLFNRELYEKFAKQTVNVTHWAAAFGSTTYLQLPMEGLFPSKIAPLAFFLPQSDTEQLLEDHLMSNKTPGFEMRKGWYLEQFSLVEEQPLIDLKIKEVATDSSYKVRTRYLIGCDGSKSVVRSNSDIEFKEFPYKTAAWLADGKLTCHRRGPGPDMMKTSMSEKILLVSNFDGRAGFFSPITNDMFRTAVIVPLDNVPEGMKSKPTLAEYNEKLAGLPTNFLLQLSEAAFISATRFWFGLCKTYCDRTKRIFLAGDAAHVHSPVGGQGMNMSIQDAFNLSWKLRLCLKYENIINSDRLLKSYELERRPIAESIVLRTYSATASSYSRLSSILLWLSSFFLQYTYKLIIPKGLRTMSQLGRNYSGSDLCYDYWPRRKWYCLWDHSGIKAGYHVPFTSVKTKTDQKKIYLASLCDREGFTIIYFPPVSEQQRSQASQALLEAGSDFDDAWMIFREKLAQTNFKSLISKVIVVDSSPSKSNDWDQCALYSNISIGNQIDVPIQLVEDVDSRVQFVGQATDSCMYVIRPDYFIGFRSRPFVYESLNQWFAKFTLQ